MKPLLSSCALGTEPEGSSMLFVPSSVVLVGSFLISVSSGSSFLVSVSSGSSFCSTRTRAAAGRSVLLRAGSIAMSLFRLASMPWMSNALSESSPDSSLLSSRWRFQLSSNTGFRQLPVWLPAPSAAADALFLNTPLSMESVSNGAETSVLLVSLESAAEVGSDAGATGAAGFGTESSDASPNRLLLSGNPAGGPGATAEPRDMWGVAE
mmetsp:Transcript_83736/g.166172  ORF Transcript_83736/g.166172 Transcript_83736/m.166172 type:complete len:209 (-) Transcript_83736:89-715(-)